MFQSNKILENVLHLNFAPNYIFDVEKSNDIEIANYSFQFLGNSTQDLKEEHLLAYNYNYVSESFSISEWNLYGSSRLGTRNIDKEADVVFLASRNYNWISNAVTNEVIAPPASFTYKKYRLIGAKTFELTNHLGNVITTISDRKLMVEDQQNIGYVHHYKPEILSIGEQYAFGMSMPWRSFSVEKYRYGMNTQEKEDDIFEGAFTAEYWEYDSRIGRRWNIDPLVYEWQSPFACFNNNPIYFADPSGLEGESGPGDFTTAPNKQKPDKGDSERNFKRNEGKSKSNSGVFRDNPTKTNGPQPQKPDILPKIWGLVKRTAATISFILEPANSDYDSYGSKTGNEMDGFTQARYTSETAKKVMSNNASIPTEYILEYNKRNPNNRIVFRYISNGEYNNSLKTDGHIYNLPFNIYNVYSVKWITPDTYLSSKEAKSKLSMETAPDIVIWTFEKNLLATKMPNGAGKYQRVKPKYGEKGGGSEATIIQPFPILGVFPLTK